MRNSLWKWLLRKHPEHMILPKWALVARAVLFPLDSFYWHMSQTRGYQAKTDTWLINGVHYSARAMHLLSKAAGERYEVTRNGDTVWLKRLGHVPVPSEWPVQP